MSVKYTDYIRYKTGVLDELGLTNSKKVAEELYRVAEGVKDRNKIERVVDREARYMLERFYNGDRSYIKRGAA